MTAKRSRQRPIDRFAAHLAHLLNSGDEVVVIRPFALHTTLIKTLAGGSEDGGGRYRENLLGHGIVGGDREPEELAERYFDAVLKRRMHLARDNVVHKAHELFLAICRRGVLPGWPEARLQRGRGGESNRAGDPPRDFASLRDRLGRLDCSVSRSNPATTLRERDGPLRLHAGSASAEVPDELCVWDAVSSGPFMLTKLDPGEPFNAFCSLVIKAVENANEHYGRILGLGLSPLDWAGDLTVNTAKQASAFLTAAREHGERWSALETWQAVWQSRKVPGFKSVEEFWGSELGRALRNPERPTRVDDDVTAIAEPDDPEESLLNKLSFDKMLELCRQDGVLDDFGCWFYRMLYEGQSIADLARRPETAERMKPSEVPDYVTNLLERVLAYTQVQRKRLKGK
jgi:hypothetical protein